MSRHHSTLMTIAGVCGAGRGPLDRPFDGIRICHPDTIKELRPGASKEVMPDLTDIMDRTAGDDPAGRVWHLRTPVR